MIDNTELKRLVDRVLKDRRFCGDENHKALADGVLALIAENEALKGPHDWLAEDLIKELVDNAQAFQENSDHGDNDPFAIVLLAAASRIRRQEGSIDKLKAGNEQLAKTADCWDRLNIHNKAISDSFRAERDQLMAENEALRKDSERLQSATAFVQKLCDAAVKQPSVATGYLHDILSAMGKEEQS